MTSVQVEGLFNMMDIYGDVQLDPVRQEYILVYVAGVLAIERDRKRRRGAQFRARLGEATNQGVPLRKHAWSQAQLVDLGQAGLDRSCLISAAQRQEVSACRCT